MSTNNKDDVLKDIFNVLLNLSHHREITDDDIDCKTYTELYDRLDSQYATMISDIYPELSISELREKFLTINEFVKSPINTNRLDHLINIYQKIIDISSEYISMTNENLKLKLECPNIDTIRQIAIIRQAIYNSYRIYPYNTQMLAMLAFIIGDDIKSYNKSQKQIMLDDEDYPDKNKIGQIKTGEGKSTIIAMIALYYAINDRYVDVVTTSHSLAKRDLKKYSIMYDKLGITSSHICSVNPSNDDFKTSIVYGTISDFEFSILREKSFGSTTRHIVSTVSRPFDVVIIDEVDNITLDAANNSARISDESLNEYDWIYRPYYNYVIDNKYDNRATFNIDEVREYLGRFGNVNQLSDHRLKELYESAISAIYFRTENVHYIVKPSKKIVIVDYENTGTTMDSCTWSFGVHQFLEIKHSCEITPEDITVAAISHYSLVRQYEKIIGLTGTSGGIQEQNELISLYDVDFFDVPPHFTNKRLTFDSILYTDDEQHINAIIESARRYADKDKRPVLIICRTIKDALLFSEKFKEHNLLHQVFTGKQITSEEEIINQAGQAEMITIATNNAGRGTDIILSKQALNNGGLHVIVTCYMKNTRTEDQAKGRAGRQGQPGSCQVLLSLQDPYVIKLLKSIILNPIALLTLTNDINIPMLRELDTSKCSTERMKAVTHNAEIYKVFLIFSHKFLEFKQNLTNISYDALKHQCQNIIIRDIDPNTNRVLKNLTNELINLQINDTEQGWKTFIIKLKSYYTQKIMQQWSDFFVRAERYDNIHELFNKFMNSLMLNNNFVSNVFDNIN